ncbi:MAG: acylphosphatase [Deltaproteobacteria bacterium]|nr:acylphosphatase [Deltaproteobacteria bacterium]
MENSARARVIISGRVQGVFFRMETKRFADQTGVTGWVKNTRDGCVEAVFEGDENRVNEMINWCKKGPPFSRVMDLDVAWEGYSGEFTSFEITY